MDRETDGWDEGLADIKTYGHKDKLMDKTDGQMGIWTAERTRSTARQIDGMIDRQMDAVLLISFHISLTILPMFY